MRMLRHIQKLNYWQKIKNFKPMIKIRLIFVSVFKDLEIKGSDITSCNVFIQVFSCEIKFLR